MKVLANEGISNKAKEILEKGGFEVINVNVAQNQLENYINDHNIDAILVGNNTQIRQELIEDCPSLKLIGSGSINDDNIDADYAIDNGLQVISANKSVAIAVAELTFAHLFGMARFLHSSNREMPLEGDSRFNDLKRAYAGGIELRGKTIGIFGFDAIGQEVARIAIGLGMNVLATDLLVNEATIALDFFNGQKTSFTIETVDKETVLKEANFITLHDVNSDGYIISDTEIEKMKDGVGIINTGKAGLLNEVALIKSIESGKVKFAGLDVFENEPNPEIQLLMNPELSLTPNIATTTIDAKNRVDIELANQIIQHLS